jgi:hypothetical protein
MSIGITVLQLTVMLLKVLAYTKHRGNLGVLVMVLLKVQVRVYSANIYTGQSLTKVYSYTSIFTTVDCCKMNEVLVALVLVFLAMYNSLLA